MSDESILGLLLRAHRECAAQAHGEEFVHHNTSAMMNYETAGQGIEAAIHAVTLAMIAQYSQKERKL